MPGLKLGYLRVAPAMKTELGFWPQGLDALCRVIAAQANLNGVLHHRANYFSETIGTVGLLSSSCQQLNDVIASHVGSDLVTVLLPLLVPAAAKSIQNIPIDRLRVCFH